MNTTWVIKLRNTKIIPVLKLEYSLPNFIIELTCHHLSPFAWHKWLFTFFYMFSSRSSGSEFRPLTLTNFCYSYKRGNYISYVEHKFLAV